MIQALYHAPDLIIVQRNQQDNPNTENFDEEENTFLIVDSDDAFEVGKQTTQELIERIARIRQDLLKSGLGKAEISEGNETAEFKRRSYFPIFGEAKAYPQEYASAVESLGRAMTDSSGPDESIPVPAGYTYLGQFIAHELTRAEVPPGKDRPENLQTPTLDLDSVYGPNDEQRLGNTNLLIEGGIDGGTVYRDVPLDISRDSLNGGPKIANPRNDDNLLLSQTHVILVSFHNALARNLPTLSFEEIKTMVVLSFQSVVLYDYLPRVVDQDTWQRVVQNRIPGYWYGNLANTAQYQDIIPAEVAFAVLRFGHSMVRPAYENWNSTGDPKELGQFLHFCFLGEGISQFNNKVPGHWIANWQAMYGDRNQQATVFARPIDCCLTNYLSVIPSKNLPAAKNVERNVAVRTLKHAARARLKSGYEIRSILEGIGLTGFQIDSSNIASPHPKIISAFESAGDLLKDAPPLWYYILREAEFRSNPPNHERNCLAGVGAQLLCETIMHAVETAKISVVGAKINNLPIGSGTPQDATMIDLLRKVGGLNWHADAKY